MKNEGGPAFPGEQGYIMGVGYNQTWEPGMTLRQWYAGMALIGLMYRSRSFSPEVIPEEVVAREAFQQADAMIKEWSKA